ncbi:TonB-dependent receptor [Massilia glaciei]|uniref:TonB-dependent receptor n=1 Tax=Massilia glaciei TaxID=1524097 RepID=A0A2U2HER9_9BURK|nr:TonB-dependent receptor [Massilia glaciei]PWF42266.1 TonB-dependent receptor [Massilia glaciei]
MKTKQSTIAAAVSAALISLSAPAVWAQQAAPAATPQSKDAKLDAKDDAITKVYVTASKRSELASKVPYNVTAIGEEELRRENITDAKRLITESVSISAPGNSARFTDSVTVRGLNVSPVSANNIEQFVRSTLAYYLDDTPLPHMGYRIKDVARVETLLGPQGTLYGSGSLGGTVRYITNQPKLGKTEFKVNTGFYQTQNGGISNDTDLVLNLPLGSSVALRASVARLDEKGYTDRVSNPPWNVNNGAGTWTTKPDANQNVYEDDDWQKVNGGRVALLWKITPDLSVTLAHTQQNQLAHGSSGVSLTPLGIANATTAAEKLAVWNFDRYGAQCGPEGKTACPTYTNAFTTPYAVNDHTILSRYEEFSDRSFKLDSIDFDWNLGFAKLHSSTSYFSDERFGQADYTDKGHVFYFLLGDSGARIKSGRSAYMTFDNRYTGLAHETRLTSTGDGPIKWIAGLFHTRTDRSLKFSEWMAGLDAYNGIDRNAKGGRVDEGYAEDLAKKYTETAVFGEVGYRPNDKWLMTLGGRVFKFEDTARSYIKDFTYDLVDSDKTNSTSDNGKAYFKFNTSYQFNPNLLSYLTLSQGYRPGGINGFRDFGANKITKEGNEYAPDSTFNKELGLKGSFLDRKLYVETAIYRIEWKDPQTYRAQDVENGFPINGTTNGPKAHTQGFEFAARYKFNSNWSTTYATATTMGELDETSTHCLYQVTTTGCRTFHAGDKLGGSAKWKHNAGVRYNTYFDNGMYLSAGLSGRYVGTVRSDRDTNGVPPTLFPSYAIYSANATLSRDKWDLSVYVRNLANSQAQVSSQPIGITGARPIYAQPRTMGVNLSYQFL